jgi:hypothetical protein
MISFLGNPKNVFWEAFLLTIIVFVFGLFIGYALENSRLGNINDYYIKSEISLMDIMALNSISSSENISCNALIKSNIDFANRIYLEAQLLEKYDEANKISSGIKLVYQRYDLLRTLLWTSSMNAQERCEGNFSVVVYIYDRETADLAKKATQNVWSKILTEFKDKEGNRIILIPISYDKDLASLNSLIDNYNISIFPVVLFDGKIISELTSVDVLDQYLK